MKSKIKLTKVSQKCFTQKGFDERGCYGCDCKDSCCKYGADFDKEAYDLVIKNKNLIEPLVGLPIEKCFETKFSGDKEFLGGNSIRSIKGKNYCIFHNKEGKGCILYGLVLSKKLNRRAIPSICKLFPLTWENKKLIYYEELKNEEGFPLCKVPSDCNCLDPENKTKKSLFQTQKQDIDDIFEIKEE
ncbi:hypothetical protein KY334_06885 [Candidatus Woesearchaeota archaeon]|nr:hypothetical protein [Candidatus Woesearchaeota archaeon]